MIVYLVLVLSLYGQHFPCFIKFSKPIKKISVELKNFKIVTNAKKKI